jgi:hypothetical protein
MRMVLPRVVRPRVIQIPRQVSADPREDSPAAVPPGPDSRRAELAAAGLVAVGAALVIWAYRRAPTEQIRSYDLIFWAGMVIAYLAVAWRAISGRHTLPWLALLGLFTVLPKFAMSPNGPVYFDETAHFALLQNVISSGKLFQFTPLLPIGTFYPGLEGTTAAIHWLTGLSPWDSALALIAVVHCLLLVQIWYIARALSVSPRWAAAAALVYAANPSFLYEDVQFAYESMAILLMLTIIRLYTEALAAERSSRPGWQQSLSTSLLITLLSFGCVVTHHLTSLIGIIALLAGAFALKPMSGFADRKGGWRRLFVRWTPVLMLGLCFGLWVAFIAPKTIPYLFPHVSLPVSQLLALVGIGHARAGDTLRTLFSNSTAPGYERVAAIAAPILIALALLLAAIRWVWKSRLRSNFLWSFLLAAAYLVSLPLTLVAEGAAGAHRTWASTFVGVSLLPAALVVLYEIERRRPWLKRTAIAIGGASLVVLLVGNTAAGTPTDYRFPGPYKFGSDTLSVTPETLSLAHWVQTHLGPGARVVTDRYTALALTGHAEAVTPLQVPGLPIAGIWYNRRPPAPSLMYTLEHQRDDYLAIDLRDTQHAATEAPLFVAGEPALVPAQNMARLAHWPWLTLRYSSAHYRLYEINFKSYYLWYPNHAEDQ